MITIYPNHVDERWEHLRNKFNLDWKISEETGRQYLDVSPDALEKFFSYMWELGILKDSMTITDVTQQGIEDVTTPTKFALSKQDALHLKNLLDEQV